MDIYRDYTTLDVLYKRGCEIADCGTFYPLTVRDYYRFQKRLNMYFTYSIQHLDSVFPDFKGKPLLQTLKLNTQMKAQPDNFGRVKDINQIVNEVMSEMCEALSLLTKTEVFYKEEKFLGFIKEGNEVIKKLEVNEDNFPFVMKVVALSNMIYQPNYYDDPEYARVIEKARKAHNKNPIDFEEMVMYVKNLGKLTYEEVMEETIFQLKCDFSCLRQEHEYRTAQTFRVVCDDKSLDIPLEKGGFIEKLFDRSDSYLFTTLGAVGLTNNNE